MFEQILTLTAFLPFVLLIMATINYRNLKLSINIGKTILVLGIIGSSCSLFFLTLGKGEKITALDFNTTGVLLQIDSLSTIMFLMVSIIGFIVVRFSTNYLQGDPNQNLFIKKLIYTIALVQLLVLSTNLISFFFSWVITSLSLQSLINFYDKRKEIQKVILKKFVIARMSDLALLTGFILLYLQFGSFESETIFNNLKNINYNNIPVYVILSGIFIALSAIIKSVQIPFHGWILDVMEAPTPVSGLLHAGLLNAGPFLIIRFSKLFEISSSGTLLLLIVGAITALYGTIVFPSQSAVKTSLAYSSIGHMGFSLMICGMGFYSAALLHLIGHSFYKAHAFLSSGSAIDKQRVNKMRNESEFKTTIWNALSGFLITVLFYYGLAQLLYDNHQISFQMLILGGIIIMGVSSYSMKTISSEYGFKGFLRTLITSGVILLSYFLLEQTIANSIASQIPEVSEPSILIKSLSMVILLLFAAAIYLPVLLKNNQHNLISKWEVYRRNGFYIHIFFDRTFNPISQKLQNKALTK